MVSISEHLETRRKGPFIRVIPLNSIDGLIALVVRDTAEVFGCPKMTLNGGLDLGGVVEGQVFGVAEPGDDP
jgi:hypothetical protein